MRSLVLSLLISFAAVCQNPKVVDIPKATWVEIYFVSIDKATKASRLVMLRNLDIPPADIEVRIWEGFGITPLVGYVFKRQNDKWSATFFEGIIKNQQVIFKSRKANKKTNWGRLWQNMESKGFCNIADDSQIESKVMVLDGVGWVVEIAKHNYYRTFLVNNPEARQSQGGDLFLELIKPISNAFSSAK